MSKYYPIKDISPSYSLEQLGTKEKFWTEDNQGLFKFSRPNTSEHWTEKAAYELAKLIDLPSASYHLASCQDRYGILSENFISNDAVLIHGNEILHKIISDYQKDKTHQLKEYKLDVVFSLAEYWHKEQKVMPPAECPIQSVLTCFIGYMIFDTWIGNQDRHHENWGLVINREESDVIARLAPSYDHASSLAFNISDTEKEKRLKTKDKGYSIATFAGRARTPFYNKHGKRLLTIEVATYLYKNHPDETNYWLNRLRDIDCNDIHNVFKQIPSKMISQTSIDFSVEYLNVNKNRLLKLQAPKHG